MIRKIAILLASVAFFTACDSPKEKMVKKITELENNDSSYSVTLLQELKFAYLEFGNKYPDDEKSAGYLFKAAQRCIALNTANEAVIILNDLMAKYPKNDICQEALFLLAFTYENSLQDLKQAEEKYKQFIQLYPKNELAEDAKLSLENLGKSPQEIIDAASKP